ncbi:MAG: hypothetical protein RLZZ09_1138, partial [Pseudomonadota bacterium]
MSRRVFARSRLAVSCSAVLMLVSMISANAENIEDTTGLADYAAGSTDVQFLKDYGIT